MYKLQSVNGLSKVSCMLATEPGPQSSLLHGPCTQWDRPTAESRAQQARVGCRELAVSLQGNCLLSSAEGASLMNRRAGWLRPGPHAWCLRRTSCEAGAMHARVLAGVSCPPLFRRVQGRPAAQELAARQIIQDGVHTWRATACKGSAAAIEAAGRTSKK